MKKKQVRIYAEGVDYLSIDSLKDFQGDFKALSIENKERLISLLQKRFISPFFIWENKQGEKMLLDGHQRSKVIPEMIEQGYEFRPCDRKGEFIDQRVNTFPVVYVYAETEKEAKENLLMISSQHGEFDNISDFMLELDKEIQEAVRLVDTNIINKYREDVDLNELFSEPNPEPPSEPKVCPHCGGEL